MNYDFEKMVKGFTKTAKEKGMVVGWWIPISEKLPPLRQHVLLSAYGRVIYGRLESEDGNSGYPLFYVCTSVGDSKPVYQETTVHSEFTTSRINAWMPLPEPYREDGETNDE